MGPDPRTVLSRARGLLPTLPPSEKRVAERLVADPEGTAALSIQELGRATGTSAATVQRLCRRLGLPGYPGLRMALIAAVTQERAESGADPAVGGDIGTADSTASIIEKIAYNDGLAVRETARQLDVAALEAAALAVTGARRTDVYGAGASAFVGADLQQKLLRIGRTAFSWADPHMALTSAALLGADDVALGVSHTGFTLDTVGFLARARESGATTGALTNNPGSPVAGVADIVLTTSARETTFRSGAMASRIAQLVVIDMLFVTVARQDLAETTAALARTRAALSERRL
jgi:DNA-binding MurR/RpiR family transcriptional regulator